MYFPIGFDIDRAIELGELVDQAYAQFEAFQNEKSWNLPGDYDLKKELIYLKRTGIKTIKDHSFFDSELRGFHRAGRRDTKDVPIGFIAQRKDCVFLIFRGTKTDQEWIRNFRISLVPYSLPDFGRVHDGFLRTYNLFRTVIYQTLDGMDPKSKLFIAGHSLGGALATMALPDIGIRSNRKIISLYTYGSPRIGDNEFVTAFNLQYGKKSFRIINTSDLVGLIPPPVPIVGTIGGYFSHVDTPVGFTIQNDDVEMNHAMETYLSALRNARAKKGILNKMKSWYSQHIIR